MTQDELFMMRAIELARCGEAGAAPNPMVGAVVVCKGRIIGEGYHIRSGGPHAEVNAINSVCDEALLKDSTIYVSLEPCAHWGKTPPCANLIVSKGIPRVVIGCQDPFAQVNGLGIQILRDAGCEVVVGVLQAECQQLNRQFFTFHQQKRPYITLKWAMTADAIIGSQTDRRLIISNPMTQTINHRLRSRCQGIMVGTRTAIVDNPSLTTRLWEGNNPVRITIDRKGILPQTLRMLDGQAQSIVYHDETLEQILADMHQRNIQHLLVEGGRELLQSFIDAGLWDEVRVEISRQKAINGVSAPVLKNAVLNSEFCVNGNKMLIFFNSNS